MRGPRDPPVHAGEPAAARTGGTPTEAAPSAGAPAATTGTEPASTEASWTEASWARNRPRSRQARQVAMQDLTRAACTESRVLIDGAAERVSSSDQACAVHREQVAKSRATIAQTRALIRRLDDR
ncbi:hypothetical protein PQJ75_04905 [Rhodoplanes sp. TEM]|uniref:Uncharacterized protein n=1 Tax=Rhodoplanes tepidamans TaxID=200616 RepID=A0ABT5JEC2_RHOTP|nr:MULTISPECIES: hypothetical protein [Rhodoplanes]MDC7787686.1 hypothetical protein [Rhodoplanes tepidamans]MDC7983060.1 hypothetical protein [Rhodoplanes sp. TEM]MDQ0356442.1 hypothetical protein [Rhodoplanes tepidamans]